MSEVSAYIVEFLSPTKTALLTITVLMQPTIHYDLSQSLNMPFTFEIYIATLIKLSPIAA